MRKENENNITYHWMSATTGEVVRHIGDVIQASVFDWVKYHFFNHAWQYSKKGW